jgi:hypothetical protein
LGLGLVILRNIWIFNRVKVSNTKLSFRNTKLF